MFFARRKAEPAPDWPARFDELAGKSGTAMLREFYARGTVAPNTLLSDLDLVALDLETTGLDPERHGIVSIGLVPFTIERVRMREAWYRVVRPRRELEDRSITIHGITHDDLENAPDLTELAEDLLKAIAGRVVVVHFHAIERRFLWRAFERRFSEGLLFPLIDTLAIEKRVTRQRGLHPSRWFRHRQSLRLADCRRRYGLPEYAPHHALTDAQATAELFQAQIAHHGDRGDAVDDWWM